MGNEICAIRLVDKSGTDAAIAEVRVALEFSFQFGKNFTVLQASIE